VDSNKRNQLIVLAVATVAATAAMWFFLVRPLQANLRRKSEALESARARADRDRRVVLMSESLKADLDDATRRLQVTEEGVARGDIYRWTLNLLLGYAEQYHIQFNNIEQPSVGETIYPPKSPYKSATFVVSGTGTYHEFGNFMAGFERRHPLIYCQTLDLDPAPFFEAQPDQGGKITFRMGLSVLVRPRPGTP